MFPEDQAQTWLKSLNTQEINDLLASGTICINDVRVAHSLTPIEGGDMNTIMTPTGIVPVARLLQLFSMEDEELMRIFDRADPWSNHKDSCACDACVAEATRLVEQDELDLIRMDGESP